MLGGSVLIQILQGGKDSWKGLGDQLLQKTKFVNRNARKMQLWKKYTLQ
jgi:hypothetical protein